MSMINLKITFEINQSLKLQAFMFCLFFVELKQYLLMTAVRIGPNSIIDAFNVLC